ncbi:SRPBCC family protein [Pendulispora rubella]|uniref:SRPBCC family protein n=1 Tax=Pendulispora rubella TaxID=2741070 RepID=A0ABZ2L591_9BACT
MSVVHSTFTIERQYKAAPARVFAAFVNPETKRRWFAEGEGWQVNEYTLDFRVGGVENARFTFVGSGEEGAPPAGTPMGNDTVYQDIVPNQRIVFAYTMTVGDKRISASLATVEIVSAGTGTKLTYTEQGAFFDGADSPRMREEGWGEILASLGREVDEA